MIELDVTDSARLDRFKHRVNESDAQKLDFERQKWREDIERFNEKLKEDERERVFNVLRSLAIGKVYFDSIEDLIQTAKVKLKG